MPRRFTAKHAAITASVVAVGAAIITTSVIIGSENSHVHAADIHIGTDAILSEEVCDGVGFASITEDTTAETEETEAEDASKDTSDKSDVSDKRYTVTFEFYGRDSISCSAEKPFTVSELANTLGITFDESNVLSVSEDTVLSEDTVITTDNITFEKKSVTTSIAFTTKYVDDASIYKGSTKVSQKGQNGQKVTEYEVKYVNGVEVSRTEVNSYVAKNPVEQIIKRGTKVYTASSGSVVESGTSSGGTFVAPDGKTYRYTKYIDVKAVWYPSGGGTYIGLPADENIIAVDPTVIPLGSQVYITGDYANIGVRTAADIGSAVKGNIIDICFDRSNPLAANFGARPMRVYILE